MDQEIIPDSIPNDRSDITIEAPTAEQNGDVTIKQTEPAKFMEEITKELQEPAPKPSIFLKKNRIIDSSDEEDVMDIEEPIEPIIAEIAELLPDLNLEIAQTLESDVGHEEEYDSDGNVIIFESKSAMVHLF